MLGSARCLDDLDPHGGLYRRRILLNEARVSAVIQGAHIDNDQLILDVGCGGGAPTISLMKKKQVHVVGIDLSDGALNFFQTRAQKQKLRKRLLLFQSDAENMPFEAGLFDRVISFSSLEHVPHPSRFIEECLRVCRPGGYVSACTPNKTADALRRLKPGFAKFAGLVSKRRMRRGGTIEGLPHSPYHKEFTDKDLRLLFEKSGLGNVSTTFLIYLPTGIPHPLGTFMSMGPVAYLESFLSKVPFVKKFSSLVVVSGGKPG
jgi:ubiquinone/menaquinone biosynthesis C-methylase UbiE